MPDARNEASIWNKGAVVLAGITVVLTLAFGIIANRHFLADQFLSPAAVALVSTTSTTGQSQSGTTLDDVSPTAAGPTTAPTQLPTSLSFVTGDLEAATADENTVLVRFVFIHSGLCLTATRVSVTQERCVDENPELSGQVWLISSNFSDTVLNQLDRPPPNHQCLSVGAETFETDAMGNTWKSLGLVRCDSISNSWIVAFVEARDSYRIVSVQEDGCLDVLGGKDYEGREVVLYECLGFDNQFVTVEIGHVG